MEMTEAGLAAIIDHTLLAPGAVKADFERLCSEAVSFGFHSVCVNSSRVELVSGILRGTGVLVCSVAGFPLGASAGKRLEAAAAVDAGAGEIDMVIDIGALREGDHRKVEDEIRGVVEASLGRPVKVILEACLLADDEKKLACRLSESAGASFVKTSTGFSTGGATVHDVGLMREAVGGRLGVKASGGISTLDAALDMVAAGADRLGLSRSVGIMLEMRSRAAGGVVQPPAGGSGPDSA
ncbi:MAG: Deoxyribose-phosphate aldolase [candidate division Hyd24-12 bacterium ADurb.Bin004]|nr:MAG: Deoxyribose-phosphate aldolase [candidate division Hyd24-12 bacterium ADurb.Bin004]